MEQKKEAADDSELNAIQDRLRFELSDSKGSTSFTKYDAESRKIQQQMKDFGKSLWKKKSQKWLKSDFQRHNFGGIFFLSRDCDKYPPHPSGFWAFSAFYKWSWQSWREAQIFQQILIRVTAKSNLIWKGLFVFSIFHSCWQPGNGEWRWSLMLLY